MNEQKKYIFTSDYTTLSGEVINKEGEVIGFSPTMTIGEIDHLLNAGILVDYPEPNKGHSNKRNQQPSNNVR